jgi:hypothetical protein
MRLRDLTATGAALLIAAAAAGCSDSGPNRGGSGEEPPPMDVVGRGVYTARFTAEVWVRGNTAYTSTWGGPTRARGNAIIVWDVSGATPEIVDSVLIEPNISTTGDLAVSDDGSLLVVATEGAPGNIVAFSLADPRKPVELSRFTTTGGGGVHTAEIGRVEGKLYAVLAVNGGSVAPRVIIVDLSDPTAPQQVYARSLSPGFMHDALLRNGLLFLAQWDHGLTIWDVGGAGRGGSPANPVLIDTAHTAGGSVHNAWWFHNPVANERRYIFVGEEGPANLFSSSSGDIHVVDISNLDDPREVAFFHVPGAGTHNFWMDEARGVLYAAYYNAGVRAIDVRGDLGACAAGERAADGRCDLGRMGRELAAGPASGQPVFVWSAQYTGDFVYASDMLGGLWKLGPVVP